jgi:prolyl-tRNA editing enzyme YbaK/EbsC (Cys-tRNA(Pro) deacylase)
MTLDSSAQKVQAALAAHGLASQVVEFPQTTRTSRDAAAAIGCTVAQIAKSLVFRARASGKPVLVMASGVNRVDTGKLAALVGEPVDRPDADFVRHHTGFAIGGVPPVGHAEPLDTYIDADLMALGEIWAAAGTPFAVFRLTPAELAALTGGRVVDIKA